MKLQLKMKKNRGLLKMKFEKELKIRVRTNTPVTRRYLPCVEERGVYNIVIYRYHLYI